ncbi:MAG: polymer-forming cytoskeletal protein, partial [Qipengyuania citrea]
MFSKKSGGAPTPPVPSNQGRERMASKSNSTFSVLGSDLAITGDITASADLHVDGAVEGDIACSALVQGETSTVKGAI